MMRPAHAAACMLLVLAACSRTKVEAPLRVALDEQPVAAAIEDGFVQASGVGASEDDAHAAARLELAKALLENSDWLRIVPLEIHDRAKDPLVFEHLADGQVRATLGLSRARAAALISAFAESELRIDAPAPWQETLHAFLLAHVAETACERRNALFGSACEPADTSDVDGALAQMLAELALTPSYIGGVPLDAQRRMLRRPGAYVLWRGIPVEHVPLVAQWHDGSREAMTMRTDARGHARCTMPEQQAWPGSLQLVFDARALLGPLHAAIPEISVTIEARSWDARRWGALVIERGEGKIAATKSVVAGMREVLAQRGANAPVEVPGKHRDALVRGRLEQRRDHLLALADGLGGRIDVLFVVEVDTRFVNRMGGTRVWYEARGTLEAYEVWSGRSLTRVETSAKASGLGNEQADESARHALGEALAKLALASGEIPMAQRVAASATAASAGG